MFVLMFAMAFGLALWVMSTTQKVQGSAPQGMRALIASSTVTAIVGTSSVTTLFTASSVCTTRVITTYAQPIMLKFASSSFGITSEPPTSTFGHLQAASTTITYDAGLYGCTEVGAIALEVDSSVASTTIPITEFSGFR